MDVYLKSSRESVFFSSQGCQAIAFAHDGGTTYTPLSSARSHSFSVSTASAGSPSTTVSRITAGGLPWSIRRGVVRACGQRAGAGRGTSLVRRGRSRSACVANGRLRHVRATSRSSAIRFQQGARTFSPCSYLEQPAGRSTPPRTRSSPKARRGSASGESELIP